MIVKISQRIRCLIYVRGKIFVIMNIPGAKRLSVGGLA
jgi:hypothetical protein